MLSRLRYLLEKGLLDVMRNDKKVDNIMPGHVVGELALLFEEPRTATIIAAAEKCVLWSLDRKTFQTLQAAHSLQSRSRAAKYIKESGVLDKLRTYTLRRLAAAMTRKEIPDGGVVQTEGEATEICYLVESGNLVCTSGPETCPKMLSDNEDDEGQPIITTGNFIGQVVLLGAAGMPGGEPYDSETQLCTTSFSLKAKGPSRVSFFTLSDFRDMIGPVEAALKEGVEEQFGKGVKIENMLVQGLRWSDFEVEGLLGEGAFGAVVLAKCMKENESSMFGTSYAVKIMQKANIVKSKNVKAVWNEHEALTTFKHPLVIGINATFQNDSNLFLVTPHFTACTMFELLYSIDPNSNESIGLRDEDRSMAARAWMAQVTEGISHMHNQGCAYRDIKPENLLITDDGRVIIIDLGFVKKIPYTKVDNDGNEVEHDEAYTLCGTYEYLAPEFFLDGTGHNHAVDYWAMGCLLFEIIYGRTPFVDFAGENDLSKLFKKICTTMYRPYTFPMDFDHKAHIPNLKVSLAKNTCRKLLARLLEAVASKRLGNLAGGVDDIKNHAYFSGTDWERLSNPGYIHPETVKPPDKLLHQARLSIRDSLKARCGSVVDVEAFGDPQDPFHGW